MKLSEDVILCALDHIVDHGDTDIFPHPFELRFVRDSSKEIVDAIKAIDLNQYHPMSVIESLIPKSKFGFRVGHQPFPIDAIVFTALVLEIFDDVEAARDAPENKRAFSYRKTPGLNKVLFQPDRNYGQWLDFQMAYLFEDNFSHAVRTDISDFYLRIYRHRLENILSSTSGRTDVVRTIERFLMEWRGGQSFGVPVGTNAARLLAEAALNDMDHALVSEGIEFTRFVDDLVLYVRKGSDPFAALAFLAQHLSANEGLSLNNQKTTVLEWSEYANSLGQPTAEDDPSNEEMATEKLFWAAYGQDDSDPAALEALMMKDLVKELEELLSQAFWDMGKIRVVLHAMRLVRNSDVAQYVRSNLATLTSFPKDVVLLIQDFVQAGVGGFENMTDEIIELLLSPRLRPLQEARAWLLELGVRQVIQFDLSQIRRLEPLVAPLDVRQINLLRWRAGDQNYFRTHKARVSEIPPWVQSSFIFGARCLPKDEYSHWIRGIKSRLQFPLAKEFADWCLRTYSSDPI
jgi:hypothetical protein